MKVEFFGQSLRDKDSRWSSSSRLLNMYREPSLGQAVLKSHLGTSRQAVLAGAVVRAAGVVNGVPYVLHGGKLQSLSQSGVVAELQTVSDSDESSIVGNNGAVCVASGGDYYVWDGSSLSTPGTGAFNSISSVTFFGQRTFVTELDGRRVSWSDVADASTFGGTNFATAESTDAPIIRAMASGGAIWVFKADSIEQWSATGPEAFAVVPGAVLPLGLKSYNMVCETPSGLFFVGSDNRARFLGGQGVSTPAVETSISTDEPLRVSYYRDEGREFCAIHFRDRPAWVYDVAMREWSERGSGLNAWAAQLVYEAYGKFWTVDNSGNVCCLERNNQDYDGPLIRLASSATFESGGEPFCVDRVKIQATVGMGDVGAEASLALATSRNYGLTYGKPKIRSLGDRGHQGTVINWRALGQFRQFSAQLVCAEPVEITIGASAEIDLS